MGLIRFRYCDVGILDAETAGQLAQLLADLKRNGREMPRSKTSLIAMRPALQSAVPSATRIRKIFAIHEKMSVVNPCFLLNEREAGGDRAIL